MVLTVEEEDAVDWAYADTTYSLLITDILECILRRPVLGARAKAEGSRKRPRDQD
jgi:hypothetical protein